MARPISAVIEEIATLEADATPGSLARAEELRSKVVESGFGDRLPQGNQKASEPSFLDNWGRPIAEAGGALTGGALGIPAGIPGIMVGAAGGSHLAGMGYDMIAGNPAPSPREQLFGAAFNSMGGPLPTPQKPFQVVSDSVFDTARNAADMPPLTAGQQGSPLGQRVEGWLESTFMGGPAIDRQRGLVEDSFRGYMDDSFPIKRSRDEVGDTLIGSVKSVMDDKDTVRTALYAKLDGMINSIESGRLPIERSQELLDDVKRQMASDPQYAGLINKDPDLMRYISVLDEAMKKGDGVLSDLPKYETIKRFRTSVGAKLDNTLASLISGGVDAEKRNLYGVLSDDLASGAEAIAGVPARQARSRADWYNRGVMDRLKAIDPVFKNADNPTKVYDTLGLMVKNNPKGLAAVKKTLPSEAWEEFSGTYLRRLMDARPGGENAAGDAVSYHTIATNLNKLKGESPESWKMLAGDSADALENIRVLATKFRESESFFNRSRTANASNPTNVIGSAIGVGGSGYTLAGPESAIASGVAALSASTLIPWMASKVVTSPSIRRAVESLPSSVIKTGTVPDIVRALVAAGVDETEIMAIGEAAR